MIAGKTRSLHYRGIPEWPARNKHTSLLGPFVSYGKIEKLEIRPQGNNFDQL